MTHAVLSHHATGHTSPSFTTSAASRHSSRSMLIMDNIMERAALMPQSERAMARAFFLAMSAAPMKPIPRVPVISM